MRTILTSYKVVISYDICRLESYSKLKSSNFPISNINPKLKILRTVIIVK